MRRMIMVALLACACGGSSGSGSTAARAEQMVGTWDFSAGEFCAAGTFAITGWDPGKGGMGTWRCGTTVNQVSVSPAGDYLSIWFTRGVVTAGNTTYTAQPTTVDDARLESADRITGTAQFERADRSLTMIPFVATRR